MSGCQQVDHILDSKTAPSCESCILSFRWFLGVWILCTDVSEPSLFHLHSLCEQDLYDLWRCNRVFRNVGT